MEHHVKPKVLVVSDDYWPNVDGGALFERRLANLLSEDYSIRVWAPSIHGAASLDEDGLTRIYRVSSRVLKANPRYRVSRFQVVRLFKDFRTWRPAIVHVHNPGLLGLTALIVARLHRVKLLGTNHMTTEQILLSLEDQKIRKWLLGVLMPRYLRWFHNQLDSVVVPSIYARDYLLRLKVRAPIRIISNGVDQQLFSPSQDKKRSSTRLSLIYVGRLDRDKNVHEILRLVSECSQYLDILLTIVGDGTIAPELRALAENLPRTTDGKGLEVRFTGLVSEEEKIVLLRKSDAFIILSRHELQCIAALEAMSSALPLIVCDAGALPELCSGDAGWILPRVNVESLWAILRDLSLEELVRRGHRARASIVERHANESTAVMYAQLITETLGRGH